MGSEKGENRLRYLGIALESALVLNFAGRRAEASSRATPFAPRGPVSPKVSAKFRLARTRARGEETFWALAWHIYGRARWLCGKDDEAHLRCAELAAFKPWKSCPGRSRILVASPVNQALHSYFSYLQERGWLYVRCARIVKRSNGLCCFIALPMGPELTECCHREKNALSAFSFHFDFDIRE